MGPKHALWTIVRCIALMPFLVASEFPVLIEISFRVLRILTINFLLRTPIWMILYSLESLWNSLQDSAKVHLIWTSFEHRLNRCLSEGPVQGHRKNRCYWFLHNSSNSAFLWVLSSCFALLILFNIFLGPRDSLNKLVSPIDCVVIQSPKSIEMA